MFSKIANVCLIVMIIGLQYRLWYGYANYSQIESLQTTIDTQKIKLTKLEQRNSNLVYEVLDLRDGSDALEEYAREEIGMIKKGEIFYQVLTPNE